MPSTRNSHPSIIQSRSREIQSIFTDWNIRVCKSIGAWHEPLGARKGGGGGGVVRGIWWFVSDLVGSCRESSLSEKRESARYCRAHAFPFAEYNESPSSMAITIFLYSIFSIHSCMVSFPSVRARINESLMARFKIQSIRALREKLQKIITSCQNYTKRIARSISILWLMLLYSIIYHRTFSSLLFIIL